MVTATALILPNVGAEFCSESVELSPLLPHEVLVDLKATGICHTDLAVQHGKIPMPFPAVLGHEGAGIVRAVGSAVTTLQRGDHVVLSYNSCGSCRSCIAQQPYQCHKAQSQNFGGARPDGSSTIENTVSHSPSLRVKGDNDTSISTCFFGQSSFCNPAVVQEVSCVKVDSSLPLEVVCALGCGFQTGAGAVYNVVKPLDRKVRHLAVFGIGGVGCASLLAARHLNSSTKTPFKIIAVDVNESRLELAREFGATHVIDPTRQTVREEISRITKGEYLDAAIDCTAVLKVINEMVELVGVGGIAVQVGGPPPGTKASVDIFDLLIKCKTYVGCHQGNAHSKEFIPWLASLYAQGHFPLETMQKTYPAKDVNVACADMAHGAVLKPILLWS